MSSGDGGGPLTVLMEKEAPLRPAGPAPRGRTDGGVVSGHQVGRWVRDKDPDFSWLDREKLCGFPATGLLANRQEPGKWCKAPMLAPTGLCAVSAVHDAEGTHFPSLEVLRGRFRQTLSCVSLF